jgi:hypothetical protein
MGKNSGFFKKRVILVADFSLNFTFKKQLEKLDYMR